MITIVTATTTGIITGSGSATLAAIAIGILLCLLTLRELASGLDDERARRFRTALTLSSIPLLVVFLTEVVVRIVEILGRI